MSPETPKAWKHRLLSVFIVFHLVSMGASVFKKTEVGAWVRQATASYERALGIRQRWGMFGTPPNGSSVLMATGMTSEGESIELPLLAGELDPHGFRWFYNRNLKLERSTFSPSSNIALRRGYGAWLCTRSAAEGVGLERVEFWKRRTLHPDPELKASGAPITPEIKRVDLQVVDCGDPS